MADFKISELGKYSDLHTHTSFCDGCDSPEEMVLAAINAGLDCIGILAHSYVEFDPECSIAKESIQLFSATVTELKEKYSGKIKVLCGEETDYYTTAIDEKIHTDYKIGSVHYIRAGGELVPIDLNPETLINAATQYFSGDIYSLIEEYYRLLGDVVSKTDCDIIGHFDLISKFNGNGELFNSKHPRYISASRAAADKLLSTGAVFEINLGAMLRGYRSLPYPEDNICKYIKTRGGKFILTSDSHSAKHLAIAKPIRERFSSLL